MWTLIIALLGIVIGFIVSMFAFEELEAGQKYFIWLKRLILLLIFGCVNYQFLITGHFLVTLLFTGLIVVLFTLELRKQLFKVEYGYYVLFILAYIQMKLFLVDVNYLLILTSLVFLYGIPLGSLVHYRLFNKKSKNS
ncbi:MAG: hypothetical protein ABIG93_00590 [archaeon]|nr:hypothetical protein [Nanoarchaeota archaeon]